MSIIYCHHCSGWTLYNELRCQQCHLEQEFNRPDPTPEELRNTWGTMVNLLGKVEMIRHFLPRLGVLLEFEHGIVFYPDLIEDPPHYIDQFTENTQKQSLLTKIWGSSTQLEQQPELASYFRLQPYDLWVRPGSFFVDWLMLEKISFHQKIWSIQYSNQRACTFQPVGQQVQFADRIYELQVRRNLPLDLS